jgi:tetratricopeptide (TPR) repeat protein
MPRQNAAHVDDRDAFARRLRDARHRAGLAQIDLAFPGCSKGYVSRLESGHRVPSLQVVRELARRLGVDQEWLAHGDTKRSSHDALTDAEVALRLDDLEAAEAALDELTPGADRPTDQRANLLRGQLAHRRGDLGRAIELLAGALPHEPRLELSWAADTLGRAYAQIGETESAIGLLLPWLRAAEQAEDAQETLRFSVLLANTYIDAALFKEAAAVLGERIADLAANDPLGLARIYWSQSRLHALQQQPASASRYARAALELLEQTEHSYYRSKAHHLLAFVELDQGNAADALALLRRGRKLLGREGNRHDLAQFRLEEARALAMLGRHEESAGLAMAVAAEFRDSHPLDLGRSYGSLAETLAELGERERAKELYELAIEILEREPNRYLTGVYSRYGEILEAEGRDREALAIYRKGLELHARLEAAAHR